MSYRVVYGETMPAWEKTFPTKRQADAFAKKHKSFGDRIFSIAKTVPGEKPQSMEAVLAASAHCDLCRLKFPRERRDGDRYVHLVDGGEKPCVGGKDFQ